MHSVREAPQQDDGNIPKSFESTSPIRAYTLGV